MDIKGHTVELVWVETSTDIAKEYYASILLDRREGRPLAMVSAQGGVDIEEVAEKDPDALKRIHIDPLVGIKPFHTRYLTSALDEEAQRRRRGHPHEALRRASWTATRRSSRSTRSC